MENKDIIKILKKYGNCYVREKDNLDLEELEKEVGFKLSIRFARNCEIGWIIEKDKQNEKRGN